MCVCARVRVLVHGNDPGKSFLLVFFNILKFSLQRFSPRYLRLFLNCE